MARIGQLFGRTTTDRSVDRTVDRPADRPADRDGDGIDDRDERPTVETRVGDEHKVERTHRLPAAGSLDADTDRDGIADRRETHTTTMRPVIDRESVRDAVQEPVRTVDEPVRPARVSVLATLGLIFGVVAVAASLTGLLAVWALPIGALGLLFSFSGIIAGARRHVAGRGLGTLGVLFSGTAVVFAILAVTGQVSWLDTDVDQVARLNGWLDAKLPWMRDW